MKKSASYTILTLLIVFTCLLAAQVTVRAATITDGYPGYPDQWEGLTTNTVIEFSLDEPVALIGSDPDWVYCVKKASFSGLDIVLSDVACTVEVSDDRKTIKLYPNDLLDGDSLYTYKVVDINFDGGGSDQDFAAYFETGENPVPAFARQLDEADMCDDSEGSLSTNPWCGRCHVDWKIRFPEFFPCISP